MLHSTLQTLHHALPGNEQSGCSRPIPILVTTAWGLVDAGWECSDKGKIIDTVVEHAFTRIHR